MSFLVSLDNDANPFSPWGSPLTSKKRLALDRVKSISGTISGNYWLNLSQNTAIAQLEESSRQLYAL